MERGVFRPSTPPIPPVKEQTEYIEAGPLTVGVEYRLLTDAIYEANFKQKRGESGQGPSAGELFDCGVSLHVGETKGEGFAEYIRFDCFDDGPHYHYINATGNGHEILYLDDTAEGDSLAWALDRIRTRLPKMLERAGAEDLAGRFDPIALEEALPRVAEAAYRFRFNRPDAAAVLEDALKV